MTQYAHTIDKTPRRLPSQWVEPQTGNTIMGLSLLSDAELAALGWYPVRSEPLEPGASGWGEMTLIEGEYVIPSMPGDPAAVLRGRWSKSKRARDDRSARKTLSTPLSDSPSADEIQARIDALETLRTI